MTRDALADRLRMYILAFEGHAHVAWFEGNFEAYEEDKVRMLGDGDAAFAKATGLTLDLTGKGLGLRSNRYSMLIKDGVVKTLNVEGPGKFEVSDAATLLAQAKAGV